MYGIQGEPNAGKTTAALSFPNPIVFNLDRKLPEENRWTGEDIVSIPFYDDDFVRSLFPKLPATAYCPRRDGFRVWVRDHASKIPADYTLIIDSWTRVQNNFDLHAENNPHEYLAQSGSIDTIKIHRHRLIYSIECFELLKKLSCKVVIIFHEQAARNEKGILTGKIRPLQDGQFKDQITSHLAMLVRQVSDKQGYWWEIKSNDYFSAMIPGIYEFPADVRRIKACWQELQKYNTKNTNQ